MTKDITIITLEGKEKETNTIRKDTKMEYEIKGKRNMLVILRRKGK